MTETPTTTPVPADKPAAPSAVETPAPAVKQPTPEPADEGVAFDGDDDWEDGEEAAEPEPEGDERSKPAVVDGPPANAKEAAAWREARGIPAEAKAYQPPELKLNEQTIKVDSADPIFTSFAAKAHALNLPQTGLDELASWAVETRASQMTQRREADKVENAAMKSTLSPAAKQAANSVLGALPVDLRRAIREARLGDGLGGRLINNSEFVGLLAEIGQRRSSAGETYRSPEHDARREQEILNVMRNENDRYYSEKLDVELTQIRTRKEARS